MQNILLKKILETNDVMTINPNFEVMKILSKAVAQKVQAIIFDVDKNKFFILTTNNYPQLITQVLDKISKKWFSFEFFYTDEKWIELALEWYDKLNEIEKQKKTEIETRKNVTWKDAISMIKTVYAEKEKYSEWEFISEMIRLSYQVWSSDLHFQAEYDWIFMRIRKDWVLQTVLTFTHNEFRKYLTKLKFMSWVRLNIDYAPQDWRFDFDVSINWTQKKIDVRVNFMPWLEWEHIVMRFLDWSKSINSFWEIWFMGSTLDILQTNLKKKSGMILVTWPTWSWKTTTLYSMLHYLNDSSSKIITLEDPVEYQVNWIQQSQINEKKWYTYEDWLKAILRQDPDIIMVWEIRTLETAEIAINAALTWHLVISTMHTNSAIEAISRLLNMWVKNYMLAPALNMIVWQRLVRKLHSCKTRRLANTAEKQDVESTLKKIKDVNKYFKKTFDWYLPIPSGCNDCSWDGYMWRIAAVETFDVNDDIKQYIINGKSTLDIYWLARQWGFLTFKEDAYVKMLDWITTLDEIRRVI